MPKINVYLPDALAAAVKDAGVPVSAVCQAALTDAIERIGRTRQAVVLLRDQGAAPRSFIRFAEGLQQRMTPRLITALSIAGTLGDGTLNSRVTSLDLLRGLLQSDENLAVRLLLAQDVDVDSLRERCAGATAEETAPTAWSEESLFSRMTMPARFACAGALESVIELGHNYVGCEHLLIGLASTQGRAAEVLLEHGVRAELLRDGLRGAIAGVVHERRTSAGSYSMTVRALTERIEAIERQLERSTSQNDS